MQPILRRIATHPLALAVIAGSVALTLPGVASAVSHPTVRDGFYSRLVGVSSADVEFHVRGHGKVPDMSLGCVPAVVNPSAVAVGIAVHVPVFALKAGRFSYKGPAEVTEDFAGAAKIGTTTLTISGYHVNGPVHHYVFEGRHLQQTTAFKGTASSPACAVPGAMKFTLFGPVPGE
jgi:hypothetical protein